MTTTNLPLTIFDTLFPSYPTTTRNDDVHKITNDLLKMINPPLQTAHNVRTDYTDTEVIYRFPVPGISPDDVSVECTEKLLNVAASNETESYDYTVNLPSKVNLDSARVTLVHGMLTVKFDKKDTSGRRKLPIMNGHEVIVGDVEDVEDNESE